MKKTINLGDIVKFRKNLTIGEQYDGLNMLTHMSNVKGRTFVVTNVTLIGDFQVDGSPYAYNRQMLDHFKYGK